MDTEIKILRSALKLSSERGLEAVTMEDIARDAGIKKASLYHYYRHRDSLIKAMLEKYAPNKEFALSVDFRKTTEEILLSVLEGYAEQCARGESKKIFRVMEGSRLYNEDVKAVYLAEQKKRKKAVENLLKLIEKRKVVRFKPFAEAVLFYSDLAHAYIVNTLDGVKSDHEAGKGLVKAFSKAFLVKGVEE